MRGLTTDEVRRVESARRRRLMAVTVALTGDQLDAMVKRAGADLELPVTAVENVPIMELIRHYEFIQDIFENIDNVNVTTSNGSIYIGTLHDTDDHDLTILVTLR